MQRYWNFYNMEQESHSQIKFGYDIPKSNLGIFTHLNQSEWANQKDNPTSITIPNEKISENFTHPDQI